MSMKVTINQVYLDPKTSLNFSYRMQVLLSQTLAGFVRPPAEFSQSCGLSLWIDCASGLDVTSVVGPKTSRRDEAPDLEYFITLAAQVVRRDQDGWCERAISEILLAIRRLLDASRFEAPGFEEICAPLVARVCSDPEMFTRDWDS